MDLVEKRDRSLKKSYLIFFALLAAIGIFNLFFLISDADIASADESLYGFSAAEMIDTNTYLIATSNYTPDYWNAKPPFAYLPVIAGYKLFGITPLGLRFFSIVAGLLIISSVACFCVKKGGYPFAIATTAILVTSRDFLDRHGARSGDPDMLYVLFYVLALFAILMSKRSFAKFYLASALAAFAFLTKSFHATTLFVTIFALYIVDNGISKKSILHGLGCILCAAVPIGVWVVLRYQFDGTLFFEKMIFRDTIERASEVIEGHNGSVVFYLSRIYHNSYPWIYGLLMLGAALALYRKRLNFPRLKTFKNPLVLRLLIIVGIPFTIYTLSASKLRWYLYCAYPFIAMLFALIIIHSYKVLAAKKNFTWVAGLIICLSFAWGEWLMIESIYGSIEKADSVLRAMQEIKTKTPNTEVYLFLDGDPWKQKHLLSARMRGLHPLPGGRDAYDKFEGPNKRLLKLIKD